MRDIKKILVPVDFSESSAAALEYALFLAGKLGARVEALHVYDPPYYVGDVLVQAPGRPGVPMTEYIREQASARLDEIVSRFEAGPETAITRQIVSGVPWQVVVKKAAEENADLIVMGTHGRRGLSHLLIGSVAEQVVRHAPCPVITLRGETA